MKGLFAIVGVIGLAAVAGCGGAAESELDHDFLGQGDPPPAISVGEVRRADHDGQQVNVVGRIGGSMAPFVDGLAAFTLVDVSVPSCADDPGDSCPTPWDYCCTQDAVQQNIVTVKLVDDQGHAVGTPAKPLLGVRELDTLVVQGRAQRDEAGNVTLSARRVFILSN